MRLLRGVAELMSRELFDRVVVLDELIVYATFARSR